MLVTQALSGPADGVLDVFLALAEVALGLLGLALTLEALVPGDLSDRFLELALGLFGLAPALLFVTHATSCRSSERPSFDGLY